MQTELVVFVGICMTVSASPGPAVLYIVARTLDAAGKVVNEAKALDLDVPLPEFALPELDANGNAVAIQMLKLETEGWELDDAVTGVRLKLEDLFEVVDPELQDLVPQTLNIYDHATA